MANRSNDDEPALLFSLSYCSRAIPSLSASDVAAIVAAARVHNARHHITGWLVWGSGIFFQWLEGGREDVKALMSSINGDTRHDMVVVLSESEEVRERLFGDWDMELVSGDDIREVLLDAISESTDAKNLEALRMLMNEIDSSQRKPGLINNLIDM